MIEKNYIWGYALSPNEASPIFAKIRNKGEIFKDDLSLVRTSKT
jgi:hypothetical protein